MKAVFLKEFRSYFRNPLGYVFIGLCLVIFGLYFSIYCMYYQYSDYYYVLDSCTSLIFFVFPILTMRIMSDETRNKTDQILLTAPVSTWDIVLGKFFAVELIFIITTALSVVQPIVLKIFYAAHMNMAMTLGAYLGFFLLGTAFIPIGIFISSKTDNQIVAGFVTMAVYVLLILINGLTDILPTSRYFSLGILIALLALVVYLIYNAMKDMVVTAIVGVAGLMGLLAWFFLSPASFDGLIAKILDSLSITTRYSDIFTGLFDMSHVVFFLSVTIFFLFLTYQSVEKRRWA